MSVEKQSAILLQETKLCRSGRIRTPSSYTYIWYELHRTEKAEKGKSLGGLALGVVKSLNPSWVSEGDDSAEALTVEIWVEGFPIRLVCGYGPQEHNTMERKIKFWDYIKKEVDNAHTNGAAFILQCDGNLWAGKNIIPGDPHEQNQNGKLFSEFLDRNPSLSVVNALSLCEGIITRKKHMKSGTQESVLDFFYCV